MLVLVDRYGHPRVLMASMGGTALCFLGMGASTSLHQLLLWRFVSGLFAGIGTVMTAFIVDCTQEHSGTLWSHPQPGVVCAGFIW